MQIAKNSVVSFTYSVATAEGEHVDRSEPGQPMSYLHGHGQIVPGLEKAMEGKTAGTAIETTVAPEEAYGAHDPELDLRVPKEAFPKEVHPKLGPGFQFQAEHPTQEGATVVFTVHQVEDEDVLVSGNHPLAGKTLNFAVKIESVREATPDELSHGHAHGPGGHHHH